MTIIVSDFASRVFATAYDAGSLHLGIFMKGGVVSRQFWGAFDGGDYQALIQTINGLRQIGNSDYWQRDQWGASDWRKALSEAGPSRTKRIAPICWLCQQRSDLLTAPMVTIERCKSCGDSDARFVSLG